MDSANKIYGVSLANVQDEFTGKNQWGKNHIRAMRFPRTGFERAISQMVKGLVTYVDAYRDKFDGHVGRDGVLRDHVKELARATIGLLNGPTDDLHCGTVLHTIREVCELAGINLDK